MTRAKSYFELLKTLMECGTEINRKGKVGYKEIVNVQLQVPMNENFYCTNSVRHLDDISPYLFGELAWYFSGDMNASAIEKYSKFWGKLSDSNGEVNSNYGALIFYRAVEYKGMTSFQWCLEQLSRDPYSKRAIALYNDRSGYHSHNKDYVCTQNQQFFIRNNTLFSIIHIRSSDAIYGLTYDIPWWSIVQQQLYIRLKPHYPTLICGGMFVNIGSSHIYEHKYDLVNSMLLDIPQKYFVKCKEIVPLGMNMSYYENNINKYFSIKKVEGGK